jgi:hypothetical protein
MSLDAAVDALRLPSARLAGVVFAGPDEVADAAFESLHVARAWLLAVRPQYREATQSTA